MGISFTLHYTVPFDVINTVALIAISTLFYHSVVLAIPW